jgi:hypothetical protein
MSRGGRSSPYRYNVNLSLDSWARSMRQHDEINAHLRGPESEGLLALIAEKV